MVPVLRGETSPVRHTVLVEGSPSWTGDGDLPGAVISLPHALLHQAFNCTPQQETGHGAHHPAQPRGQANLGEVPMYSCLFDLEKDPTQTRNLAKAKPDVVDKLQQRWAGFRKARSGQSVTRNLRLDPAMVEMLQRTGYDFRSESE
jgi:hypothetical protein